MHGFYSRRIQINADKQIEMITWVKHSESNSKHAFNEHVVYKGVLSCTMVFLCAKTRAFAADKLKKERRFGWQHLISNALVRSTKVLTRSTIFSWHLSCSCRAGKIMSMVFCGPTKATLTEKAAFQIIIRRLNRRHLIGNGWLLRLPLWSWSASASSTGICGSLAMA